jgi:hypothetical protein
VAVGVDEPGHHDRVGGIDLFRTPGTQTGANLGNAAILDEDIGLVEVLRPRPERENATSLEQRPTAQYPLPESTDLRTVS